MNASIRHFLIATSFAAVFATTSTLAAAPAPGLRPLSLDCAHRDLPSLATVGSWYGTNNAGRAYELRTKLMITIRRACHGSPDGQVTLLVPRGSATPTFFAQAPTR